MKLLANSSNVYKILDRSQHKLTKYLNGQKAHNITINEFFKRLNYLNDKLFEVGSANSKVQHKEHVIFCFFFILYYALLRRFEFYYFFFQSFCEFNSFEVMEMERCSLYLAPTQNSHEDCIQVELKKFRNTIRENACSNELWAHSTSNFFPQTCCGRHIKHDERELGLFKEEFCCTKMIVRAIKFTIASMRAQIN